MSDASARGRDAAAARPGVLRETPGVTILDTRELAWEAAPEIGPGALRKPLGGGADEPRAWLLFLPPGFPVAEQAVRYAAATGDVLVFTLAGELCTREFDGPGDSCGRLVRHRPGVAVQRPPGATFAAAAEPVSATGWIGLVVRDSPGAGPAPPGAPAPSAAAPAAAPPGAAAAPPTVSVVDSRLADWQPAGYSGMPPGFQKTLARYPCGDAKAQLLFFPPGLDPGRDPGEHPFYPPVLRAARHLHHVMIELIYVLDGDMPLSEWDSAEQQQGERAWWREGYFLYRRPGSIHGAEPGATSVTGVTILHFRLGGSADPAGPAFPEQVAVDVPFAG